MIKNIIFDWSGVINNNLLTSYHTAMRIFEKYGAPKITLTEFRKNWDQPYMRFYHRYLPDLTHQQEVEAFALFYPKICRQYPPRVYPGIPEVLRAFQAKRIAMIILSSDFLRTIKREIANFGLAGIFTKIISNVHDKREVIEEAVRKNHFQARETVFVGDTTHEIEAGEKARVQTAAVTWGYQLEEKLKQAKPDFIVHNAQELKTIICAQRESFS